MQDINRNQQNKKEPSYASELKKLYQTGAISRRQFLKNAAIVGISLTGASAFLAACGAQVEEAAPAADSSQDQAAAPTQEAAAPTAEPEAVDAGGGVLNFGAYAEPADLDPHTTGDVASWLILDNIAERLVMLDESQNVQPRLAESWEISDDGLVYTFNLRKGVKFHNGREMVADDVQYTIERIMDPDVPARAKGYFQALDNIEIVDDYTVKLEYTEVFAPLLIALARLETSIVPKEAIEAQGGQMSEPVGTGPFKFGERVPDVHVRLDKFEDHWDAGLPYLESVFYKPITDNDVRVVNIKTGDIDVASQIAPKDVEDLQNTPDVTMALITGTFWPHVGMNCQREPFNDVKVRQAVHYGLNRPELNELAYFGQNTLSESPIPPDNPFHEEITGWDYDPEKAKQLLADAGYPDGFSTVMRVIRGNPATEVVQAQLKQIGIEIEVHEVEASEWFSEVFNKSDFWMTIVAHASKVDPDLSMLDIQHSGELGTKNYTQFSDPEMDRLLEEGRATTDFEERKEIYAEAQRILVERSGYVVLGIEPHRYAYRDHVENFTLLGPGELRWWETKINA